MIIDWPRTRGSLRFDVPLAPLSWFRVGGPAKVLFQPEDRDDLADLLKAVPSDMPIMVIGVASNLLIRDGGIDALVIRLGGKLAAIEIDDDVVVAGAGALDQRVAQIAGRAGLGGIEFMIGIPGTIGGAVMMNAGAFGGETAENLIWAELMMRNGRIERLPKEELGLSYRKSRLPRDCIVLSAAFKCRRDDPAAIRERMTAIKAERERVQPLRVATGGSTFKNPDGGRAWQLIDQAGMRGFRHGHAQVSEKHCNFLINDGKATALELEELGEQVRAKVKETSGVDLHWEIKRVGMPS